MIRYSGGAIVDTTYISNGLKSQMIDEITAALTTAGWTGLGSGLYQSATSPTGFRIRVDVIDTGGLCVHLRLRSPTLTNTGFADGFFLFPAFNRTFRIIANQYQLFHFYSGSAWTTDPSDVAFGVPYLPPFLVNLPADAVLDPWLGWMSGNGVQNPGGLANSSNQIGFHGWLPKLANGHDMWIFDTVAFYNASGGSYSHLIMQIGLSAGSTLDQTGFWEDGSISMYEPYISWASGHAVSGNWSPGTRHGQLWDAIIYAAPLDTELTVPFDGNTWRNVTHQSGKVPHSLLLLSN